MDTLFFPIFTYLMWGLIWFFVSVLVMVLLFGLAGREVLKDGRKILIWFIVSLSLPLSLGLLSQQVRTLIVAKNLPNLILGESAVAGDHVLINLTTDTPAIVYLEMWEAENAHWLPLLATGNLEMRTEHFFLVLPDTLTHKLVVNINGVRQPLSLPSPAP